MPITIPQSTLSRSSRASNAYSDNNNSVQSTSLIPLELSYACEGAPLKLVMAQYATGYISFPCQPFKLKTNYNMNLVCFHS